MNHRPKTALRILIAAALGAMASAGQVGQAQTPAQTAGQTAGLGFSLREAGDPQLKINPLETLRNFEPSADEEYRLGKGDEITVDFTGRPDLLAKLVVGPDGRITLPLAGDLMLAGLTRAEAAKTIDTALSAYYQNLEAQVTVTKYTANKVLVLGAVEKPGVMTFDGTPTLLEALSRAGMETGPNKAAQIPERCAIYRGHDEVVWVDLKTLIDSGNPLADLRLRRDDVIYVPTGNERFVSVLGQVQHPGAVPLTGTSTLASVLANAGGFTDAAGNKPHIQIVDPATGSSRIISFNDLLNPAKALEIMPKPGEIIFVPQSGLYRATYVVDRLSPLITAGALIGVGLP
jgi:polysaccharide biosynthesis/export protein